MPELTYPAGATVLVVDDAPPNVKLLRLILKDAGYNVLEASSGPEALEILHSEKPDAMVLDVRMPGMTGYEVCRQIREEPGFASLPVIMVTALSLPGERIMGIEAGATDFITKPFNKKELLARLRASLVTAEKDRSVILPQLPGAVLITDPAWSILCLSPQAAILLGIQASGASGLDLTGLMGQAEKDRILSGDHPELFQIINTASGITLDARQTPVSGPDGNPLLRVVALSTP
ncbi:MAG: response regulator [Gammaproteobacteria bacterium]|nr:response regulator [Gammaproteobacteria bacterium]MBU1731498.1 response regulator [Gammaproteobacteria bacterium]MBU1893003.1 response regulator [Gammaproteobacteria bacterium]